MNKFLILTTMIIACMACSNNSVNPEKWTDEEVNNWFGKKEWLGGWNVQPDSSVNKRNLAIQYLKNKRHWDQAFNFLKLANLNDLPKGKQELEGEHVFVSVDEYTTKNMEDTRYESHKKYLDIQYVIRGEEVMGITTSDKVEITEPYNETKDIAFYNSGDGKYVKATPGNFLVFFPDDMHRPCVKADTNSVVKKIVVKIMMQ